MTKSTAICCWVSWIYREKKHAGTRPNQIGVSQFGPDVVSHDIGGVAFQLPVQKHLDLDFKKRIFGQKNPLFELFPFFVRQLIVR